MKRVACHIVVALVVVVPSTIRAQDRDERRPDSIRAVVTYLTAEYVYLDAGRRQGLHNGDTLAAVGPGGIGGLLAVSGTAESRALTTFASEPFAVAIGDTLLIRLPMRSGLDSAPTDAPIASDARPSILDSDDGARARRSDGRPVRFSGRVRLHMNGVRTATGGGVWDSSARTYASPSLSIRLAATDLPGEWDAIADIRLSRRLVSNSFVTPETRARIYRVSLVRRTSGSPLEVEAGRFPLRQDPGPPYWDGIRGSVGGRVLTFGAAVGLDPDRFDGFVQTDVRKVAAYATMHIRGDRFRSETTVSGTRVMPDNGWLNHTYFGVEQSLRFGDARADGELVLDQDPESGDWVTTRLDARGLVPIGLGLSASARYRQRRQYAWWRTEGVLGVARTQQSLGMQWSDGGATAQVAWTANTAAESVRSTSWTAYFRHAELPVARIGMSLSAGVWSRTGSTSRHVSAGLSRPVGRGRIEVMWRHYESRIGIRDLSSDAARLSFSSPVGRHLSLDGSTQYQFGTTSTAVSFTFGIGYSF